MAVPITGKSAIIDGAAGVGFWKIDDTASDAGIVHSGTEGAVVRVDGNLDWKGVYQSYGYEPQAIPGGAISFKGEGSDGDGYSGAARVSRVDIIWDIINARPVYHNVFFEANGLLTVGASVGGGAATYAAPVPSDVTIAKWGEVTIPNVSYMKLTLIALNAPYVDTEVAGQVKRLAGNVDVYWMYRRNIGGTNSVNDVNTLPARNEVARLQFYVDAATNFWDIQDARVLRVAPIYDIEGGRGKRAKVVAATVSGKLGITPDNAAHEVKSPDGVNFIDFTD